MAKVVLEPIVARTVHLRTDDNRHWLVARPHNDWTDSVGASSSSNLESSGWLEAQVEFWKDSPANPAHRSKQDLPTPEELDLIQDGSRLEVLVVVHADHPADLEVETAGSWALSSWHHSPHQQTRNAYCTLPSIHPGQPTILSANVE